jgi:hypothetical protein
MVLLRQESAPERRLDTERGEVVPADELAADPLRFSAAPECDPGALIRGQVGEDGGCGLPQVQV